MTQMHSDYGVMYALPGVLLLFISRVTCSINERCIYNYDNSFFVKLPFVGNIYTENLCTYYLVH
jgi:hypothetical protein